jgi:hypothetical protein
MMKEFLIDMSAVFIRAGWFRMFSIVGVLIRIPSMGGIRIMARKTAIAER